MEEAIPMPDIQLDTSELVSLEARPMDNSLDLNNTHLTSTPEETPRKICISTILTDSMIPDVPPTPIEARNHKLEKALLCARLETGF